MNPKLYWCDRDSLDIEEYDYVGPCTIDTRRVLVRRRGHGGVVPLARRHLSASPKEAVESAIRFLEANAIPTAREAIERAEASLAAEENRVATLKGWLAAAVKLGRDEAIYTKE
ncbi:hypothetical protein [Fimbriiglobus ruber]|uniref:Uncharacterized protein n=1 Tax=Fimbriiglobus ruber TaxID=1908690 RepID=A0A225DAS9_9BACT|nr:hypothetical protein [Fimbriiglobus ruber]OWK34239.1 hypothetical protein FRUB_10210 [Fimbriiglobus ruber]